MESKLPCTGSNQAVAGSNPVGPVFMLLFFMLCANGAHALLLVSNASVGEQIYVFYEGEELQNKSVRVQPPFGEGFELQLMGNAAQFNASQQGKWTVVFEGEEYAAFAFAQMKGGTGEKGQAQIGAGFVLAAALVLCACAFAFVIFAWKGKEDREIEFIEEGQTLVLKSVVPLEEAQITDAGGKIVWASQKLERAGKTTLRFGQMRGPYCLRAKIGGEKGICIYSNGNAREEKNGREKEENARAGATECKKKKLERIKE